MLKRNPSKNTLVFAYYLLFVFIIASVIFTASSLQYTFLQGIKNQDDIIVSVEQAGRHSVINESQVEQIELISGIKKVTRRVYGFYDAYLGGNKISINGIDFVDAALLANITPLVDEQVKALFERQYYQDKFVFENKAGVFTKVALYRTFKPGLELFLNDTVIVDVGLAQSLLGYAENQYTDVTLIVPNPYEIDNIIEKLALLGLEGRTKNRIISDGLDLFEYQGRLFLSLYLMAFLGFMMVFYIQACSQGGAEKKQIGILRAIGWSISDIIVWRLLTALIISVSAFSLGLLLAYLYVFLVPGNLCLAIFIGGDNLSNNFVLLPHIEIANIALLCLVTIIPFIASTLYPAWKVAVSSPSEAIK
ncbi:ABC transporter permease [Moritella yayanosii]|nr:FtsX-like permease family protein [Moritella yayanosii]